MLFNSLEYAIFLPIAFLVYWFVVNKNLRLQNLFLLVASYLFYGWWDWRFLSLIVFSSIVDFFVAQNIAATTEATRRKFLLGISLAVNLGLLGFFKYYNFFVDSFVDAFGMLGMQMNRSSLNIILPVGISFYTFQTLSYTIDVYRRQIEPSKDPIAFFAFVSFFPQLVAGPIERASNLLPQFLKERVFSYKKAKDGTKQILWGLFKKIVIADTCAVHANYIFDNSDILGSGVLILGAIYFAFQIYGDFSGYSDIALGTAKLFGFTLMINFKYPYFSRDIAEFWRRWHISLSTWFRDYLYIPLGGSRVDSMWKKVRNVFAIFLVSGFWHGANWTFIAWGAINALLFIPIFLSGKNRKNLDAVSKSKWLPSLKEFFQILLTFSITTLAWIFFRAENIGHAISYIANIFNNDSFWNVQNYFLGSVPLILIMLIIEWSKRTEEHPLRFPNWSKGLRLSSYFALGYMIMLFKSNEANQFIYFQF